MFKRPRYIALTVVVVLVVILLNLPAQTSAQLKLALGSLFLPLFGLAGASQAALEKSATVLVPRKTLLQRIHALEQTNQLLMIQQRRGEEIARENERLRRLVALPPWAGWQLKTARVVGGDPANWWRSLVISLGSRDGMRPNLTVITGEAFLVGRVSQVGLNQSLVVIVGDPHCQVSALIQETRDSGIVIASPGSTLDTTFLTLTYLSRTSQLRAGQTVVTSGKTDMFPKGLPIGQIIDFRSVDFGLYWEARIKRAAPIHRLEEVLVLVP
jgi:rod shape-determining protein MreC